jgi:hypothetical protein
VRIDHVIYGTPDLDAGAARFASAGLTEALTEPFLPFFIEREDTTGPGGIERVEVSGDAGRLTAWLDGAELPVDVRDGAPAMRAVTVRGRRL